MILSYLTWKLASTIHWNGLLVNNHAPMCKSAASCLAQKSVANLTITHVTA